MTQEELKLVLENHQHYLKRDVYGWEHMRANLRYVDLRDVDLSYTNLMFADLSGADLREANFDGTDLSDANLRGADLSEAKLCNADLSYADLSSANLSEANLCNADLSNADLSNANLTGAVLRCADLGDADLSYADLWSAILVGADLSSADLRGTDLSETKLSRANLSDIDLRYAKGNLLEFRKGKILTDKMLGFKKCRDNVIVTLEIPRGAIVFSINGTKCRTNRAKVIAIDDADRAISQYKYMSYYVGDEFNIYDFNCEYNVECGEGIHFFTTKEEAINYSY